MPTLPITPALQRRLLILLLWLAPFAIYLPAVTHHYGMRDDYSMIRETHEETGKAVWFTGSHGRPVYGTLLEVGFGLVNTVDQLMWLRLASVLLLTWVGLVLWRQFRESGWESFDAAMTALVIVFLPASQITVSWTVGWPWGFALIMAVGSFRLVEKAITEPSLWQKLGYVLPASMLYTVAALIYQSDALFAVVPIAAVLLSPVNQRKPSATLHWLAIHLVILVGSLTFCYGLLQWMFAHKWFVASGRLTFETDILSKLQWLLSKPMPNAVTFFTLRDDFAYGETVFWCSLVATLLVMFTGAYRAQTANARLGWLICMLVLPWLAHAVSVVAAERTAGYRTMFALSGLSVVLVMASLGRIIGFAQSRTGLRRAVLAAFTAFCAFQAGYQSDALISIPQEREWKMINDVVSTMPFKPHIEIYLIEPMVKDRSTRRIYRDEYGSLSADSDWVPKEMFKQAMHKRFPDGLPRGVTVHFLHTKVLPDEHTRFDYLIDMRTLKQWRQ